MSTRQMTCIALVSALCVAGEAAAADAPAFGTVEGTVSDLGGDWQGRVGAFVDSSHVGGLPSGARVGFCDPYTGKSIIPTTTNTNYDLLRAALELNKNVRVTYRVPLPRGVNCIDSVTLLR